MKNNLYLVMIFHKEFAKEILQEVSPSLPLPCLYTVFCS